MKPLFFTIILFIIFTGCSDPWQISNPGKDREVQGMKPVYTEIGAEKIFSANPRSIFILENVVAYKEYILVVEKLQGVHVIDNSDPTDPTSIGFWNIPGIKNFTIDAEVLYVPITDKLITIDITDINNIKVINIVDEFFQEYDNNEFPEGFVGSFECVDHSKGVVVTWIPAMIFDPKCWR